MFAVRDKRSNKFLKAFNGTFNRASFYVQCAIAEEMLGGKKKAREDNDMAVVNKLKDVSYRQVCDKMFCLKTPNDAQLYKSENAVGASIGTADWIEIVPVTISVKRTKK